MKSIHQDPSKKLNLQATQGNVQSGFHSTKIWKKETRIKRENLKWMWNLIRNREVIHQATLNYLRSENSMAFHKNYYS